MLDPKTFWKGIREGYMALECQRKIRPKYGDKYVYDWDDITLLIQAIAFELGYLKEGQVTDYGQFSREDEEVILPKSFPDICKPVKPERCSKSNNMGLFIGHLANLRKVLKNADNDGFCLDELILALPEFEQALKADNTV